MKKILVICLLLALGLFKLLFLPVASPHAQEHPESAQQPSQHADRLVGRVIHVGDGDSFTLLDDQKKSHRIRMGEIDAPEMGQAFGHIAKKSLQNLIDQQIVSVVVLDKDRYGRIVGTVYLGEQDANEYQVREGMAWVYRHHLRRQSLLALENDAKEQQRGLWQQPKDQLEAPWDWRKNKKHQQNEGTR